MAFSGAYLCRGGRANGVQAEPEELTRRFVQAWQAQVPFNTLGPIGRRWWMPLSKAWYATAQPDIFRGTLQSLRQGGMLACIRGRHSHADGVAAAGHSPWVISNWDDRLRPLLKSLELAHWFEVIHVSAEIGAHKPDARIFQTAAESLGTPPARILHVGDGEREDHQGALVAGFNPAGFAAAQRIPWPTSFLL